MAFRLLVILAILSFRRVGCIASYVRSPMISWSAVLLSLILWAFGGMPPTAYGSDSATIHIVTSTTDLASLVRAIGGNQVQVMSLALGYQDPHLVPVTASSLLKLTRADLIMVIGLQMESAWLGEGLGALSPLAQSRNPRIQFGSAGYFDLSPYVHVVEIPNEVTRAQGNHPLGNSHYWLDPENARSMARAIAAKLGTAYPMGNGYFQQRLKWFEKRLSDKEKLWDTEMKPYRGFKVVSYHRSWGNFLQRFGLGSVGEIEPFPGIPPDEKHMDALIREMQRQHAQAILVEPPYRLNHAKQISSATGAKIIVLPGSVGGIKQTVDYFSLIDYDITALIAAFR